MRRKPQADQGKPEPRVIDVQGLTTYVRSEPGVVSISFDPVTKKLPLQIGAEVTFRLVKITREVIEE